MAPNELLAYVAAKIFRRVEDGFQVIRPHVLTGISTESGHADVDQVVQVVDHLPPHIRRSLIQIEQTYQTAFAYLNIASINE